MKEEYKGYKSKRNFEETKEVIEETPVMETKEVIEETPVMETEPIKEVFSNKEGTIINCSMVNVRVKDSTDSDILTKINVGDKVTVKDELNDFYLVVTDRNVIGYIKKDFVAV